MRSDLACREGSNVRGTGALLLLRALVLSLAILGGGACAGAGTSTATEPAAAAPADAGAADADTSGRPEGCCDSAADCNAGESCMRAAPDVLGFCLTAGTEDACYDGSACPLSEEPTCDGVDIPACDGVATPTPGQCKVWFGAGCCDFDSDCDSGRCERGNCVGPVGPSECYTDDDCPFGSLCGGLLDYCLLPGPVPPLACEPGVGACCESTDQCTPGAVCVRPIDDEPGACVDPAPPGRCWLDEDCPESHGCHGQVPSGCGFGGELGEAVPGICTPPGGACTPIEAGWVQEWCDAAHLVVWNGTACEETCPGCCGCETFCDKTFETMEECRSACLPPTGCALWDGSCDDALPAEPWWAYTAAGCVEVDTCVCEGCPGAFATQEACAAACVE